MATFKIWGQGTSDAIATAAAGGIPSRFVNHKFGRNSTTAAGDAIWETGGVYPYLSYSGTPLAMRVKAGGNAADAAAGAGARSVTIQGLDGNFEIASETVTLNANGTLASAATTTTFSRVLRVFVAGTGANRVNTAAITIEDSGGGATYATINAGKSQSQIGFTTIPAGYRGYLTHIIMSTDVASGSATVEVEGWQRTGANTTAAPFPAARLWADAPSMSKEDGFLEMNFEEPILFDEYTDIWFEGTPSTGTPKVVVDFTVLFERK